MQLSLQAPVGATGYLGVFGSLDHVDDFDAAIVGFMATNSISRGTFARVSAGYSSVKGEVAGFDIEGNSILLSGGFGGRFKLAEAVSLIASMMVNVSTRAESRAGDVVVKSEENATTISFGIGFEFGKQ